MQYISLFLSLIFISMGGHAFDLSQKLAECEIHFKAKRLTTGEGGTALACYEAVLKKYPTNSEAWRGLDRIKARYQSWMNRANRRGQQSKVQTYQKRIGLVDDVKTRIQAIQARLRQEDELEKTRLQAILNTPTSTKHEVFVQLGHSSIVSAVAFSPDGKLALSGSWDNTLKLWEVSSGREIRSFTGHSDWIQAVAFSPDGKLALSGSSDNTLKLWEVSSGRKIRSLTGHSSRVDAVAFSPDGKLALSGSLDKTLKLWKVSSGREIRSFTGHSFWVNAVAFSPDGRLALSGSGVLFGEGELKLWDVSSGREIRSFTGHSHSVSAVAFSPDGKLALSGSYDNTLKLWEVSSGREIRSLTGHSAPVGAVAFSPDGKLALSGSMDNTLKLWDVSSGREIRSFTGHSHSVSAVAFSPDGKLALSGSYDNTLKLWEVSSGREIRSFTGHSAPVWAVAFSPDGKLALSGYKTLKLWEVSSGREIRTFFKESSSIVEVQTVAFSPDGKFALSGGYDMLKLWEVSSGREIRSLTRESVKAVAFSPDGKLALSGSFEKTLKLWLVSNGREIRSFTGHSSSVEAVAFSPDGKLALSGGASTLKLWEVSSGREIQTFKGHSYDVKAIAFSPDGKLALSGSGDSTIRLWNIQTGDEIAQMVGFDDGEWVTITPEGYYTASLNGAKYINVSIGTQSYSIDQYEAIYHRPDIVKLAIKLGDTQQAIATHGAQPIQIAQVQPPKIWFVSPQKGYQTQRTKITVKVETQIIVDNAESLTFKVNGRPVGKEKGKRDRAKVTGSKVQAYSRQVPLQIGENWIEVEVRGQAGAVERRSILVIRKGTVVKKPDLYYLGIGVAAHPSLPLKYPVKDVTKLAETFKKQQGRTYNQVFIKTLTDQQATRINLIKAISRFFEKAQIGDIAIIYISGHGMNTPKGYHFLTYDASPDFLQASGASWQVFEPIYKLKAHVFMLVDTCRAGNIVNPDWKQRAQDEEARPDRFLRGANNSGVIVFASSSGSDVSQEDERWGHSAFAKALLDGLNGDAADKKGRVLFDPLRRHVMEQVADLTDGLQQPTIPRLTGTGKFLDFVLARK